MAGNSLVLKNSSVAGKIPLPADIAQAELAVNTADAVLYSKNSAGEVIELGVPHSHVGSSGSAHALATATKAGFLSAADKAKLDNLIVNSSTITSALGFIPANQDTTYTKVETDSRIQAVVGAAPAALDTLVEIAAQLANDESAVSALTTTVSNKVDKVSGKGLSTNDFTTAEKTKLTSIESGAQVNPSLKTINGNSIIGTGDLVIASGSGGATSASGLTFVPSGSISATNVQLAIAELDLETQTALGLKANQTTTYTKTETDSRIQAVVGAAPAALDTLVEIAAQLANDESAVSALTTTVSGKQATITGAASTITSANLAASMVMVTDANGKAAAHSTVSTVEIGYLDGVTSAVQDQINVLITAVQNVGIVNNTIDGGTFYGITP